MTAEVLRITSGQEFDILERFNTLSAGSVSDGGRDRESIRRQLALEKEDLQICFVNEIASDDEVVDDLEEVDIRAAAKEIANLNISKKAGQIIVPIYSPGSVSSCSNEFADSPAVSSSCSTSSCSTSSGRSSSAEWSPEDSCSSLGSTGSSRLDVTTTSTISITNSAIDTLSARTVWERQFRDKVQILQAEARRGLLLARMDAKMIVDLERSKRQPNYQLLNLVGLKNCTRMSRRILSNLSLGQLNVILNDFLAQIEELNESLVSELLARDERVMEQDAMLTDIQDLAEFTNLKL